MIEIICIFYSKHFWLKKKISCLIKIRLKIKDYILLVKNVMLYIQTPLGNHFGRNILIENLVPDWEEEKAANIYIYIYIYIYHHHRVVPPARISLTLSRHFSLSSIASGRSSGLHPVSSQSCCIYVRAGRPAFARPNMGVHWSTSLMSSSLLLQQCPACLVRLTWIVFVMGGRWPYSRRFVGFCLQDLFNIARSILVI